MMSKKKTISTNNTSSSQTVSDILDIKEEVVINELASLPEIEEDFNTFENPIIQDSEDRVMIRFLTSFWSNRKGDEVVVDRKMLSVISKKRYKII